MKLDEFPKCSNDTSVWPWTEAPDVMPATMSDGSAWPKISIITPSYNQGDYIEETIRSVLLQGYPNLEYMIFDGGSSDQTVDIIKKYEEWISFWESKPDRGQAHAINKGFELASGDIVAWLNSDDYYLPTTLFKVAECFRNNQHALMLGDVDEFSLDRELGVQKMHNVDFQFMLYPMDGRWMWHQPGTFVPAEILKQVGLLEESLHYAFDKDWMFRLMQVAPVYYMNSVLTRFRVHANAKTTASLNLTIEEIFLVNQRFLSELSMKEATDLRALYHVRLAGLYLIEHKEYEPYFDRWRGISELLKAVLVKPSTIFSSAMFLLLCRSLAPQIFWRLR